jgi:hypothetical protein
MPISYYTNSGRNSFLEAGCSRQSPMSIRLVRQVTLTGSANSSSPRSALGIHISPGCCRHSRRRSHRPQFLAKNIPLYRNCVPSKKMVTSRPRLYTEGKNPGTKMLVQNTMFHIGPPGSAVRDPFDPTLNLRQSTFSIGYKYKLKKKDGGDDDKEEEEKPKKSGKAKRKKAIEEDDASEEEVKPKKTKRPRAIIEEDSEEKEKPKIKRKKAAKVEEKDYGNEGERPKVGKKNAGGIRRRHARESVSRDAGAED